MRRSVSNRDDHDPWWDLDGEAARGSQRRRAAIARVALVVSILANVAVAVGWYAQMTGRFAL